MARIARYSTEWLSFNSKQSSDYPILINTTNYYKASSPFETHHIVGRSDYYLMYIIDGQLNIELDSNTHTVKRGTAIIFPPEFGYKYSGNPPVHYLYAHFTGSYADKFLEECGFGKLPCIVKNDFSVDIQSKFNLLIDTFLYKEPLSTQKSACLLQEILIDIRKNDIDKSSNLSLKESLKHIHSFFTNKIDVPKLAKMEGLSSSRYITVFKNQTGKAPMEYVIDLRLQLATSLLENTNMTIKQISERVGYSDQYFFSRLFKKHIGISPQGYRKDKLL